MPRRRGRRQGEGQGGAAGGGEKYAEFPNVAASCLVWAGELEEKPAEARARYAAALAVPGVAPKLKESIADRTAPKPGAGRPWPAKFAAPPGPKSPGPWGDPADLAAWPNTTSRANGDAWLVANHDKLKVMRPRLLVVNFSNEHPRAHVERQTRQLIAALAESSRYHGSTDPTAPAFLKYEVFKTVDLRDTDRQVGEGRQIPLKDPSAKTGFNLKYRALFGDDFAKLYAVADPRDPQRFLRLDELLDGGYVHEVWFFTSGSEKGAARRGVRGGRTQAEVRRRPQAARRRRVHAGRQRRGRRPAVDGAQLPAQLRQRLARHWLFHGKPRPRPRRLRQVGRGAVLLQVFPRVRRLRPRRQVRLPFADLYALESGPKPIRYTDKGGAVFSYKGQSYPVENYRPVGGSAHFPPNARGHYDLDNGAPVNCTMADWRTAPKGAKDKAKPFTNAAFRNYRDLAPDCMGAWLVYWRQNMPGYRNKQLDDDGKPMKNWWPFLFY